MAVGLSRNPTAQHPGCPPRQDSLLLPQPAATFARAGWAAGWGAGAVSWKDLPSLTEPCPVPFGLPRTFHCQLEVVVVQKK